MAAPDNIVFCWDNQADRADSVVADGEVDGLPVTNLQDPARSSVWRKLGTTAQIDVTLADGEQQPVKAVALVDPVLTPGAELRVRAWADAHDGAELVLDEAVDPSDFLLGYGFRGYGTGGYGGVAGDAALAPVRLIAFVPLPDFVDARFWRINLSDDNASYMQAARLYMGDAYQPRMGLNWGWEISHEQLGERRSTPGGQTYGQERGYRTVIDGQMDWLDIADRVEFDLAMRRLADSTPFICVVRPVGGIEQVLSAVYCTFANHRLAAGRNRHHATPLRLEEDL